MIIHDWPRLLDEHLSLRPTGNFTAGNQQSSDIPDIFFFCDQNNSIIIVVDFDFFPAGSRLDKNISGMPEFSGETTTV